MRAHLHMYTSLYAYTHVYTRTCIRECVCVHRLRAHFNKKKWIERKAGKGGLLEPLLSTLIERSVAPRDRRLETI